MGKRQLRKVALLLVLALLVGVPGNSVRVFAVAGVTVTNQTQFMAALAAKQSPIIVSGAITLGDEADGSGKMLPVVIPGATVIQGMPGASLDCRCPIQIAGDGVVIKDIELLFSSSDALGSVPHREIFLAGHSLTLDNVETYLAGAGGSLGALGGSEEELLPSVYAGGFEDMEVGRDAALTVLNASSDTMFQGIYLSHGAEYDSKVPYIGEASLNLCPKVTIREGIVAEQNESAVIAVSGQGNLSRLKVYGNENTTLSVAETELYNASLYQVENLRLSENAYVEFAQGELINVALEKGACLDLNKTSGMLVQGDFAGGIYEEDVVDERGMLVLNEERTLVIEGRVSGSTVLQTDNRSIPGSFVSDKQYITALDVEDEIYGFLLPDSLLENYEMYYEADGWYVYTIYQDDEYPVVDSVDILYAPTAVDIADIVSDTMEAADTAPYCEIVWRDEKGNAFSTSSVEMMGLYFYDTVIGIKTEYWQDEEHPEATDWGNALQFRTKEETPGRYYFYVYEEDEVKIGEYTFLFLDTYHDEPLDTVADVKALGDRIKAEMTIHLYDSAESPAEATDIGTGDIVVEAIEEQIYTGKMLQPKLTVSKGEEILVEGIDYCVTYENNIAVGNDTAMAILVGMGMYCGTREVSFSIGKAEPQVLLTMEPETPEYEQELTFEVQVTPYYEKGIRAVSFYCGDDLLGSANLGSSGKAVLTYLTTDRKVPTGESLIRAEFGGTENLERKTAALDITLQKKPIGEVASIILQDFEYDGSTKTTEIVSVTDVGGVTYAAEGTAELSSAEPGSYGEARVQDCTLIGVRGEWYRLAETLGTVTVSPAVTITRTTEDIGSEEITVEAIEAQPYCGEGIEPAVRIIHGEKMLQKGVDYQLRYEDNVAIGTDTAKVIVSGIGAYHGSRTEPFSIIKATPAMTVTVNGETEAEVAYEDLVTLTAQLSPYYAEDAAEADSVSFYCGDILLGTAEVGGNGLSILAYDTTEQKLAVGAYSIRAEYTGSALMEQASEAANLALERKTLQAAEIASITLRDFVSDGSVKTTEILSVTDTNDVTYTVTGIAELASGAVGSYEEAKVLSWELTGDDADWYQLPEAVESVAVSPAVTITAAQKPKPDPEPIENPFGDVKETDWFYPYVAFAYKYNLMGGKGQMPDGTLKFDPGNTITRAEFVQMLYSKENKPAVEYTDTFTDVPDDKWFTDAILWAAQEEIVGGKRADYFDVNGKITRQEIALILYKYALYKEYDVSETENADLAGFADAASVSTWADTAMKWAVEYNVIGGKTVNGETLLSPGGNAIRAEAATMMKAFMSAYEEVE